MTTRLLCRCGFLVRFPLEWTRDAPANLLSSFPHPSYPHYPSHLIFSLHHYKCNSRLFEPADARTYSLYVEQSLIYSLLPANVYEVRVFSSGWCEDLGLTRESDASRATWALLSEAGQARRNVWFVVGPLSRTPLHTEMITLQFIARASLFSIVSACGASNDLRTIAVARQR